MLNNFFNSAKNIGLAIIVWAVIAFGAVELSGMVYVNFFQHDPNAPIEAPSVDKAQYEVYVKANRMFYYSNQVDRDGSVVTLTGYYFLDGSKFRYTKLTWPLDEKNFGPVEVTKR